MDGDQRQLCFEADNYGTRMRWYITAPATGNYTFWIAGDDNSELWLSLNDNAANKVRIGWVSVWTDSRQWDKYSTQKSPAIPLTQGHNVTPRVRHFITEVLRVPYELVPISGQGRILVSDQ